MYDFGAILVTYPIIPAFIILNLLIGVWAHRKTRSNTFEDYALASRSLPTGVLVMTLFGTVLSMTVLGYSGLAERYGMFQFVMLGAHFTKFMIIGTFIAPFLVYFADCNTLGDLASKMYGRKARIFAGVISLVVSILMVIPQIQAIGKLGEYLLMLSPRGAIIGFGIVIVLYSVWGGMRAVSYTDILQAVVAMVALSWVLHVVVKKVGGIDTALSSLPADKMRIIHVDFLNRAKIALAFQIIPVYTLTPPVIQRMLMTGEKRQVRKTWYTTAVLYTIVGATTALIGICMASKKGHFMVGEGTVRGLFIRLVKTLFIDQPMTRNILFLGLLAIGFSTVDSFFHSIGVTLVQDIIGPIRELLKHQPLHGEKKVSYARMGVGFTGFFVICVAYALGGHAVNILMLKYAILVYALIVIPVILGIFGIKSDTISWASFSVVYMGTMVVLKLFHWEILDYFLVAVPLGLVAYFIAHIAQNKGVVILKRSELTVSERLWLPSRARILDWAKGWLRVPFRLRTIAARKVVDYPVQPITFSVVFIVLYFLSNMLKSGHVGGASHLVSGIVGIALSVGLLVEGIWWKRLVTYLPMYWFAVLFYTLPFFGTFSFFQSQSGLMDGALWLISFVVLAFLVDSATFFVLSILGVGLAYVVSYAALGGLSATLFGRSNSAFAICWVALLIVVFLFGRAREAHMGKRLVWNRIASGMLGHDLRMSAQILDGAGHVIDNAFKEAKKTTDDKGEKGRYLPKEHADFLADFSKEMITQAVYARKDITNFLHFMESQILGSFEQEEISMRDTIEDAVNRVSRQIMERVEIVGSEDFKAKVLTGVFPNVISNLLKNASVHGKAEKIEIKIDETKRTITVRDNGKGIAPDILPYIFDLNYSTAGGKTNAGMGLAFVKMVMQVSGGKIHCYSKQGDKGSFTEFQISF